MHTTARSLTARMRSLLIGKFNFLSFSATFGAMSGLRLIQKRYVLPSLRRTAESEGQ